ncbi:hypothetical protein Tco_0880384 [Tanacetum coccineum]
MLCHSFTSFPLFKSPNSHTSSPPPISSSSPPSSSMSCSNYHSNFSRKPRMSVRQVWKRNTSTPKSSPFSQKDSPPLPQRVNFQSPSPPSYNLLRDQMINQLHNISTIIDSHTNPSNAYFHAPPSPPPQPIHPPSHAQGGIEGGVVKYGGEGGEGSWKGEGWGGGSCVEAGRERAGLESGGVAWWAMVGGDEVGGWDRGEWGWGAGGGEGVVGKEGEGGGMWIGWGKKGRAGGCGLEWGKRQELWECDEGKLGVVKWSVGGMRTGGKEGGGGGGVVSKDGYKLFLTLVDDFSRAVWVYLLKSKTKVGEFD